MLDLFCVVVAIAAGTIAGRAWYIWHPEPCEDANKPHLSIRAELAKAGQQQTEPAE